MLLLFLLLIPFYLLGFCWTGFFRPAPSCQGHWFHTTALAVALSVPAALLLTQDLALLGAFHAPLYLAIAGGLAFWGHRLARPNWRHVLPGLGLVAALILLTVLLPHRMQWVAGGWDSGTYICEGAELARTGSIRRPPEPLLQFAGPDATRETLTHIDPSYHFREVMPVVPLHADRPATAPFFFPLTPALFANAHATGGPKTATKANFLIGFLAILLVLSLLKRLDEWGRGGTSGAGSQPSANLKSQILNLKSPAFLLSLTAAVWLLHPMWLYHMNFTTSEVLQAFLLLALGLFLVHPPISHPDRAEIRRLAIALVLLTGVMNRIDFVFFGAVFVLLHALTTPPSTPRREAFTTIITFTGALAVGYIYDLWFATAAVQRIGSDATLLGLAGGLLALLAFAAVFWNQALSPRLPAQLQKFEHFVRQNIHWFAAAALLLLIAVVFYLKRNQPDPALPWQLQGLPYFLTWPTLAAAALGFFALDVRRVPVRVGVWLLLLAAIGIVMLLFVKIHPSWPWAARRHLFATLPLFLFLGTWGAFALNRRVPGLGIVILLAVLLLNLPRTARAWFATSDDTDLIAQFDAIDEAVPDTTLLICDHFAWSVPLRFLSNQTTFNGEPLWNPKHADRRAAQLALLRDYPGEVAFLTSTERGMDVYPESIRSLDLIPITENTATNLPSFTYRNIQRARYIGGFDQAERDELREVLDYFVPGYAQTESSKTFRLFRWNRTPAGPPGPSRYPGTIRVDIGTAAAQPHLGRGWDPRRESARSPDGVWRDTQWITHLEADVTLTLPADAPEHDHAFRLAARAHTLPRVRQSVALYANGTFIDEWPCHDHPAQEIFVTRIPARHLRTGNNRLTLRVGYARRPLNAPNDPRELALQVDYLDLWPLR